jgi:hypothetical protein
MWPQGYHNRFPTMLFSQLLQVVKNKPMAGMYAIEYADGGNCLVQAKGFVPVTNY